MEIKSSYLQALELVKANPGTSGQQALAKCILSLYDPTKYGFSIGEVVRPLDGCYLDVALAIVGQYAAEGETEDLREAGGYVYENFPHLVEVANAMQAARRAIQNR